MFTVLGHDQCAYCTKAIELIIQQGGDYDYIDVKLPDNKHHLDRLRNQGFSTVPQIYFHDSHIGGYMDLLKHFKNKDQ